MKLVNISTTGSNGTRIDTDASLLEARKIIKELRKRNFTLVRKASRRELAKSRNASIIADRLMFKSKVIEKRADEIDNDVNDLLKTFENVYKESKTTKKTAENATALILKA